MDSVKLRKRVVELQEQLTACIRSHGAEVSSLRNEITSLSLSVEQREAENQRLQLVAENLERDLRKCSENQSCLQAEKSKNEDLLNAKLTELTAKHQNLQRIADDVTVSRETERQQSDKKLKAADAAVAKYKDDFLQLKQCNDELLRAKAALDRDYAILQDTYASCQIEMSQMTSGMDQWAQREEKYQLSLKDLSASLDKSEILLNQERRLMKDLTADNESLKEAVKHLELGISEEKSCRQTIEKVTRQHQAEAHEKQRKNQELIAEIHRLQNEIKAKMDRATGEVRKKDRLLQSKVKELEHRAELCTSLKNQLDEITGSYDQLKKDLQDLRALCGSTLSSVRKACVKMLGKKSRNGEGMATSDVILQDLNQCCASMREKDHQVLKLEQNQQNLEAQLADRKRELDSNKQNIYRVRTEMDGVRAKMNELSSRISFADETISVQNREQESLKLQLSQATAENAILNRVEEDRDQVFKRYLCSLGQQLTQGLSVGSPVSAAGTLVQVQSELSTALDRAVCQHCSLQSQLSELQDKLQTADSCWTGRLKKVLHKHKNKVDQLKDKIKVLKEKEEGLCDKLRGVSIAKEVLLARSQKTSDSVGELSKKNNSLQRLLVLFQGALLGSAMQIQQLCAGKTFLLIYLEHLRRFQNHIRQFVCSLRNDFVHRSPLSRFRSAVLAVVAARRLTTLGTSSPLLSSRLSAPSALPGRHLRMFLLPDGRRSTESKAPFTSASCEAVLDGLKPTIGSVNAFMESPSSASLTAVLKAFSLSLSSGAELFCSDGEMGWEWRGCRPGLQAMPALSSSGHCLVATSHQIGTALRDVFEQLLSDVSSAKQARQRLESRSQQMVAEKDQLLARVQLVETLELKVELLQNELGSMVSPNAHHMLQDELGRSLQRETEEQRVIGCQAQHLQTLQDNLLSAQQEVSAREASLDEAIKDISGLRTHLASGERKLRHAERSSAGVSKEKRRTEKQLRSSEQAVKELSRDKLCLLDFLTHFQTAFQKMDDDVCDLTAKMSNEDFLPSSLHLPSNSMAVSKFPACQELQEVARKTLVHAATRMSSLQRELTMCQNHVQSLRQELQEVYSRNKQHCDSFLEH